MFYIKEIIKSSTSFRIEFSAANIYCSSPVNSKELQLNFDEVIADDDVNLFSSNTLGRNCARKFKE